MRLAVYIHKLSQLKTLGSRTTRLDCVRQHNNIDTTAVMLHVQWTCAAAAGLAQELFQKITKINVLCV
jgi:hypothetical protein